MSSNYGVREAGDKSHKGIDDVHGHVERQIAVTVGVSPQKLNAYTVDRPLLPQLAAIGYTPADITYLALSHFHRDHVANASLFAKSTWIVQKGDRDAILAPRPVGQPSRVPEPIFFEGLADAKSVLLNGEDHDVFGYGTVVLKSTPGHTPGHQSLFLKLANTGNVMALLLLAKRRAQLPQDGAAEPGGQPAYVQQSLVETALLFDFALADEET
jgi:glyoxylase-like metal-dependent hydrolase (beta-lactamase superfamily II)